MPGSSPRPHAVPSLPKISFHKGVPKRGLNFRQLTLRTATNQGSDVRCPRFSFVRNSALFCFLAALNAERWLCASTAESSLKWLGCLCLSNHRDIVEFLTLRASAGCTTPDVPAGPHHREVSDLDRDHSSEDIKCRESGFSRGRSQRRRSACREAEVGVIAESTPGSCRAPGRPIVPAISGAGPQ
ncbi:hypothetical protein Nepgr_009886 [Nepenthes gracilis]|uniref:Uncharacterized protein n=1 Tax=Nepenthes gracilis TaxID=150966 RepID=A0AAD3SC68_NEPGR|nr:hypothetical protein Nepgr_009886 [Nepenthes gracilis]